MRKREEMLGGLAQPLLLFLLCLVQLGALVSAHQFLGNLTPTRSEPLVKRKPAPRVPLGPTLPPAPSPLHHVHIPRHFPSRHRHHPRYPRAHPPAYSPKRDSECEPVCSDPLTNTPLGSPCGCVLPMQVELDLGVATFRVLNVIPELEVEVAAGTYIKQSQVRIMAAVSSGLEQEKTRVDIDLLPLGDKFDNMTAFLIFERFWQRKIPINASVFGDYQVIYIRYPGLPSAPHSMTGQPTLGPSESHELPFSAKVPPEKSQKMNPHIIVIIVLSSVIFTLMCSGVACFIARRKKIGTGSTTTGPAFTPVTKRSGVRSMMSSSFISSTSTSLVSTMAVCPPSVKTFTLAELELATDQFNPKKVLGEGGFGRVYHGNLEDGTEVAIKLLTREDQTGNQEFIAEVEMLSRLHHRNLVKLIGICVEGYSRCLVYELIRNGSVDSHLHGIDKTKSPLDWDARMKIALGAARGLAYLHEDSNPRVIHRDFKASNILLDNDFTPKVSDFGLAREASEGSHHISTRVMGTFGYVAPEYAMTGHLLVKSDVYSYGVVLLELLSGRKPVDMSQPPGQENLVTWARPLLTSREGLDELIDPSLTGTCGFDNVAKVAAIASMCVHPEVSQRPFMGEVVQALKLIYNVADETCEDSNSLRESSVPDCDYRREGTGSGWWNGGATPRLTFGYTSSFITMEYSSGPMDEIDRPHSTPSLVARAESLARLNRSCPIQSKRRKRDFAKLRGSMSEHDFLSRRFMSDGYWL